MADTITTECKVCEQVTDLIPSLDGGVCDECRANEAQQELVSFAGTTKYFTKDTKVCKDCSFEGRHGHSKECKKDV